MKYLEHELDIIEFLKYYGNIEILADWLNNEASLNEIDELVELLNKALLYRKLKDKKENK